MKRIPFSAANYSSHHHQQPHQWLPEQHQPSWQWSGQSAMPGQRVVMCFDGVWEVQKFVLDKVSTDVTTQDFRLGIFLQSPDGFWRRVDEVRDQNINRTAGELSQQEPCSTYVVEVNSTDGPYEKQLDMPFTASAIALLYEGHGWFSARAPIEVYGEKSTTKFEKLGQVFHSGTTVIYNSSSE